MLMFFFGALVGIGIYLMIDSTLQTIAMAKYLNRMNEDKNKQWR